MVNSQLQQSREDVRHYPGFRRRWARLGWKGVIKSCELTQGRQMLDKQPNPRLSVLICLHPLLCRAVYSEGQESHSLYQYKGNTPSWRGSGDWVQVWNWCVGPRGVFRSKSLQADVPLGAGSRLQANLSAKAWESSHRDERARENSPPQLLTCR